MYNKIVNPSTNRKVNINSKLGKYILKKYLSFIDGGSNLGPREDPDNPCRENLDNVLRREEQCEGKIDEINMETISEPNGFCTGPRCISRQSIIDVRNMPNGPGIYRDPYNRTEHDDSILRNLDISFSQVEHENPINYDFNFYNNSNNNNLALDNNNIYNNNNNNDLVLHNNNISNNYLYHNIVDIINNNNNIIGE